MNPAEHLDARSGSEDSSPRQPVFARVQASRTVLDQPGFARRGFADQLSIETPEQVALEFPVAGLGSRFVALLLDHLMVGGGFVGLLLVFAAVAAMGGRHLMESLAGKWFLAGGIFLSFVLFWGYFALFEAFWHGQTPGKRVLRLRVIKDAGRQITFFESLARNLLRVADFMPGFYLAGVVTMLCNQRNKRLGDLAAGTIVVHERSDTQPLLFLGDRHPGVPGSVDRVGSHFAAEHTPGQATQPWQPESPREPLFPAEALARLSAHDLLVIEAFFARALDLPLSTRASLAYRIAGELTAKMQVPTTEGNPERTLEAMAAGLRARRGNFPRA